MATAIEHIAGLKGFKKFMKKNNLGTFYLDAAAGVEGQNTMYKTMEPVVAKILKDS